MREGETSQQYADRVRADHYLHWFVLLSVAFWAGAAFGWLWGIGTFGAVYVAILISNTIILAVRPNFRLVKFNRWFWIAIAILWIIISSATIGSVGA